MRHVSRFVIVLIHMALALPAVSDEIVSPSATILLETSPSSDSRLPSKTTYEQWLWAQDPKSTQPYLPAKVGKWLLFIPKEKVDQTWQTIQAETRAGKLGPTSKVSTAFDNPKYKDKKESAIIIYTYDWTDKKDVLKVRKRLCDLGFTQKLYYKTDEMTRNGIYGSAESQLAPYAESCK